MYIYQMHAVYNTCCFPSPSATQPSPLPQFFPARVAIVLALRGFQALGSVKRLETIVLLWRYINKIELNCVELFASVHVCARAYVCVWMCVCVTEREGERERHTKVFVSLLCVCVGVC